MYPISISNLKPSNYSLSNNSSSYPLNDFLDLKNFESSLSITPKSSNNDTLELQVKGVDAPLINALRRIMMDDVQSMAIDKAIMYQNTSVINDEVLVHRLGLIPIKANPKDFEQKREAQSFTNSNTIKFKLHVKCNSETNNATLYGNEQEKDRLNVYASDLMLDTEFHKDSSVHANCAPLFEKILIAKLALNQEIECELFCSKNSGKKHVKWSPVATVFFKLMPVVRLNVKIAGEDAEMLEELCPKNVFKCNKKKVLEVVDQDNCSMCRACVTHPDLEDKVFLGKERMNYLLTIESVGVLSPIDIFSDALQILKEKCEFYEEYFNAL